MNSTLATLEDSPKREAVLGAALELFADRGFHGTPVPLIAERARVGAGTVYRYFPSKESLVNALYQRWKAELGSALFGELDLSLTPRRLFHAYWERMHDFARKHPTVLKFLELHHHQDYLDEASRELEIGLLLPVREFVERLQRDRALKPVSAEILMAIVWGSFTALQKAHWEGYVALTPETIEAAEECVWHALRS